MELSVYEKPANFEVLHSAVPEGALITVTEAKNRVYFHVDLVEEFKMMSYPPTFAITNDGEWALCLMVECEHSFPLKQYRGTYFFQYTDIVNRILKKYQKTKIYFTLEKTSLPHVFILKEFDIESYQREKTKKYSKQRKFMVDDNSKPTSYYDLLLKGIFKSS